MINGGGPSLVKADGNGNPGSVPTVAAVMHVGLYRETIDGWDDGGREPELSAGWDTVGFSHRHTVGAGGCKTYFL